MFLEIINVATGVIINFAIGQQPFVFRVDYCVGLSASGTVAENDTVFPHMTLLFKTTTAICPSNYTLIKTVDTVHNFKEKSIADFGVVLCLVPIWVPRRAWGRSTGGIDSDNASNEITLRDVAMDCNA